MSVPPVDSPEALLALPAAALTPALRALVEPALREAAAAGGPAEP